MNSNNSGSFWWGLIIGLVVMAIWNHPQFQGKTAEEWKVAFDSSQQTVQDWQTSYNSVGSCLKTKAIQWDSINTKYTYDNIYTYNYSIPNKIADNGWIYSGFNTNSTTSPTEEMKNCFTNNYNTGY